MLNPLVRIRFASPAGHSSVSGRFLKYRSSIEELNVLIFKAAVYVAKPNQASGKENRQKPISNVMWRNKKVITSFSFSSYALTDH